MPTFLLDTTVLSNFAHVQRTDLLALALNAEGAVTPLVLAEIKVGESTGYFPPHDWSWLGILRPTSSEQELTVTFARQLDAGEAECLAVAISRDFVFLSDDLAARRLALHKGVTVSGTLGVFTRLLDASHITLAQSDTILSEMIEHGYRSPIRSIATVRPT